MSACVLDASVAIKLVVTEPGSEHAQRLRGWRLLAPDLLWPECANILWKAVRRGIFGPVQAEMACAALLRLPFEIAGSAALMPGALRRAMALGHPAYDCLYLELAEREGLPLVTADRRLLTIADAGTRVIGLEALP
ncbi:type II toxin-antitoxin system VapC family toxin [Roseomonas sp. AR75]|uniref:type II toxin-antitoxin system VapC family toxin n=1 Tax=Roseomonas sp. AR75 TaxID=2562311 RepID=UPI0010C0C847|nr:type II toxin-antitoxin system VapC family toxin [Roseomonas sp. AR75]